MTQYGYDPAAESTGPQLFPVQLCCGETLQVQTEVEQRWFEATKAKYLSETRFTDTTDLQDMDRLLALELLMFRWNQHLASGRDYEGNLVDDDLIRKQVKEQSETITRLKTSLSLDKKSRDAALNEGNFATWLADVKRRAKLFGIHRETQLNKALSLMNELSGIIGAYDRSDEEERKKLGFESESEILQWVRETMLPEFRAIDEYFIENEQKLWKRDL
jgi:hypothetical protein